MYKGHRFFRRARYAWAGILHALKNESSFRTQCLAAMAAACAVLILRPGLLWAALVAGAIAMVLMAELINTALEELLDGLHPDHAPFVQRAKDCAAGAVLVASGLSVVVFILMLCDRFPTRLGLPG